MTTIKKFNSFTLVLFALFLFALGTEVTAGSHLNVNDVDYFKGKIDAMSDAGVRISGIAYSYGKGNQFLSAEGRKISSSMFSTGEEVLVHVNTENKVLILKKIPEQK